MVSGLSQRTRGTGAGAANSPIDHFTVVCFVAWPLNEGEAGGDLALIETFLRFLC